MTLLLASAIIVAISIELVTARTQLFGTCWGHITSSKHRFDGWRLGIVNNVLPPA